MYSWVGLMYVRAEVWPSGDGQDRCLASIALTIKFCKTKSVILARIIVACRFTTGIEKKTRVYEEVERQVRSAAAKPRCTPPTHLIHASPILHSQNP